VAAVRDFHRGLPGYRPTPLVGLDRLAAHLGVAGIWVKDESRRAGLNAFKVLGASYALSSVMSAAAGLRGPLSFPRLKDPSLRRQAAAMTCITATDGNHGRAVAWAARQLGCRCVVFMPKGSSAARLENIQRLGADASIIDGNYDEAVTMAEFSARRNGWLLIQDTARPGYEEVPLKVMQGYTTMFEEAMEQLGAKTPTHVFLQCGVGSYAAAGQAYLAECFGERRPVTVVVEPTAAACYYLSIHRGDGRAHKVTGDMETIMAGLACGEPNPLAWEILRDYADLFVACSDDVCRRGMRVLGNPLGGDTRIVSGESGAVTLGLVYETLRRRDLNPLRQAARLTPQSKILLFSTEGDTDPEIYREVVWGE
jgi:diaminopropionate ammonia-lyase